MKGAGAERIGTGLGATTGGGATAGVTTVRTPKIASNKAPPQPSKTNTAMTAIMGPPGIVRRVS